MAALELLLLSLSGLMKNGELPIGVHTPLGHTVAPIAKSVFAIPRGFGSPRLSSPPGGYNETYGYPDGIGGLIVEGPFPYKNGPAVWSDDTPWGAFGYVASLKPKVDSIEKPLHAARLPTWPTFVCMQDAHRSGRLRAWHVRCSPSR